MVVQLFELMKKQEETHQQELAAKKLELQKALAEIDLVRHFSPHHCWPSNLSDDVLDEGIITSSY